MSTIHEQPNTTRTGDRRRRHRGALAALALGTALLVADPSAAASDPATCYPLAADVGSVSGAYSAFPDETVEALMAPLHCSAAGVFESGWPAEADAGGLVQS